MKRFQRAALAGAILVGLLTGGAARAGCTLDPKAEFPVTMAGTRPLTKVRINGVELTFMIDSGAFFSSIGARTAAELKLRPAFAIGDIGGVGGRVGQQISEADTFSIRGYDMKNYQFEVLPGFERGGVAGVIGHNMLMVGDVDYDFAGGMVRVMMPKGCGDSPLAYWAVGKPYNAIAVNPVKPGQLHTMGAVSINGQRVRALFDTGASVSLLRLDTARRLGLTPDMTGARDAGVMRGIGPNPVRSWVVPVADFRIGDEEVHNTHLRIGEMDPLDDVEMLVGADFFLSHHVFVSNTQRRLYFTYNGGPVFDLTTQGAPAAAPPAKPAAADPAAGRR